MIIKKNNYALIQKLGISISICILMFSCLTNNDETIVLVDIPEEFKNGWTTGIHCIGEDYDSFMIDFELNRENEFWASNTVDDYDIIFSAHYNSISDSLYGRFHMKGNGFDEFERIDEFVILWSEYDGGLIELEQKYLSGRNDQCVLLIHFYFDSE